MINKITKSGIILKLAVTLLCLVLITTHLTFGLYARYSSYVSSEDSARVAAFVIETDLDHIELGTIDDPTLQLGGLEKTQSVQLPFYITNSSEVKVGYSVSIDFDAALPAYLTITLSNSTTSKALNADGAKSEFEFSDFGTLAIGSSEIQKADLTLTISVSDLAMITDEVAIPTAKLTVRVSQID